MDTSSLRKAFKAFDANNDGTLDSTELLAILTRPGGGSQLSESDAQSIIREFDTNGVNHAEHHHAHTHIETHLHSVFLRSQDGVIDVDEFIALMTSMNSIDKAASNTGKPSIAVLLAAAEEASDVDFSELITAPGGCFRISDTAKRAMSLEQLERVVKHVAKRLGYSWKAPVVKKYQPDDFLPAHYFTTELGKWEKGWLGGEHWRGKRPNAAGQFHDVDLALQDVNLYDCCKYVITPATAIHRCSFVELMASGEQPPHYFVSHVRTLDSNP